MVYIEQFEAVKMKQKDLVSKFNSKSFVSLKYLINQKNEHN